jgi:uncharacterized membrane protein
MAEGEEQSATRSVAFKLFLIGFALTFIGVVVVAVASFFQGGGSASGGLIIFVGPVPIILGAGPYSFLVIILAVILTIIGFVVFLWMRRQIVRG